MNSPKTEASPKTILRLAGVLRRTGLSRSTLYNRIAKGEFPNQVSLGGRAIGWLEPEIDNWINARSRVRPLLVTETPERVMIQENESVNSGRGRRPGAAPLTERMGCIVSVKGNSPDLGQLTLVGTAVYFDKNSGSFWLKLVAEDSSDQKR